MSRAQWYTMAGARRGIGRSCGALLLVAGVCAAIGGFVPRTASAGGLGLTEVGSPDTGLAGAGYGARAQDASTLYTNPAGMTRIIDTQFLLGIQPIYGDLNFDTGGNTSTGGGDGGNSAGWIPGGSTFFVHSLSPDLKVGFGLFSYFGSSLDYGDRWAGRYYVQNVTLIGLTLMPAAAYRLSDQFSVGAGLNAMYGILSEDIAVNNAADRLDDGQMKIEDETWGFGGELGLMFEANPTTRFGLTYMTPVDLDFEDSPEFGNLGPALEGILGRREFRSLHLDMTVPQSLMASAYHELDDRFALLGSVGWQDWSRFGRVGVEIDSAEPRSLTVNRKYQDTFNFAVGLQVRPAPDWVLSCGVAYDTSMVKDRDRTPDTPVGATLRFGLGAQYAISDACTLGVAYTLIYMGDMDVDQERGPLSGRLAGQYDDARLHVFTISIIWKP